ncbi:MAG: hypothetical protein K2O97_07540 [Acetatifactor sp.]|nr:hypothetical protein [Acetatifactor sp.]MDE7044856.1 hypothetical protein [Acetatifactor sp.]
MNRQVDTDCQGIENTQLICCLQGQIYIELPRSWSRLPDEAAAEKFPYRAKPQEVYGDPEADRLLTLNLLEKPLQEKQVYPAICEMQRLISHLYPESIRDTARLIKSGESTAGYFLFITGGIDHDTCHAMFLRPIHERMMMGGYHFPTGQTIENKAAFLGILKSVHTDTEEGAVQHNGQNRIRGQNDTGAQSKI